MEILEDHNPSDDENCQINFQEHENGFDASLFFKQDILRKIKKTELKLSTEQVFNMPTFVSKMLKRKNEVYYFVSTKEMHVDIKDTKGHVYLPLISKNEINSNLQKISSKVRSKISTVHLGAIKICLKAEFRQGINSPIRMALIDNRINDRKDSILGAATGNLAYQKFIFTVYPKFGLGLNSKNLDQVLSFYHEFERSNLMNEGDKVFSLTYLVGYALTNSHHSIDYRKKENVEIEDIFSEIGTVKDVPFTDIKPPEISWSMNISRKKSILGEKPKIKVYGDTLEIGETSNTNNLLVGISKRIDHLTDKIKDLTSDD